ncbi:MAG: hypothetical protein GY941_26770 [Planctomycetes bacterium]|nr:hypothetical protein [Planctomycetota bacterium]
MVSNILKDSIIVVAHPDDEILWFSSLVKNVDHVLFCFSDELADPDFGRRRKEMILNYPLQNSSSLEIASLGIIRPKSFISPRLNRYGIELVGRDVEYSLHKKKYKDNYHELRRELTGILNQYQNVITHNPWGEYGHEEHVQIYRVVNELQEKMGYNLWYSNYCSSRTINLIAQSVCVAEKVTLPTDIDIAIEFMELYERNNCWTWYKEWSWPSHETLVRQGCNKSSVISSASLLPLNFVLIPTTSK